MAMDKETYDKIEQLEQALTTERARCELQQTALASLQLAYDDKIAQVERDLDSARTERDSLSESHARLLNKYDKAVDLLEQERATFRDMSDEHERARQGAEQAAAIDRERLTVAQQEVRELTDEQAALRAAIAGYERTIEQVRAEHAQALDEAQQKVAFALDKMRAQADDLDQAQREATALRVKVANVQTTFDVERTSRLAAERAREQVQAAYVELRQELRQALDENQSLMRQSDDLRRTLDTTEQRLTCAREANVELAREADTYAQRLTCAQRQIDDLVQVRDDMADRHSERLTQLHSQLDVQSQEVRRLQAALDELAQERDDLQTGYNVREDDHEQRLARVYAQVADRDQEIADMRLDYYQACTGLDEQRAQVLTLEQQVLVLKAKLYDAYMMHPGLLA